MHLTRFEIVTQSNKTLSAKTWWTKWHARFKFTKGEYFQIEMEANAMSTKFATQML